MSGLREELAVGKGRSCVAALAWAAAGRVEVLEELAELLTTRARWILDKPLDELREERVRDQVQVFREHAPNALEDEVAERVRPLRQALDETFVEVGDESDRFTRQVGAILGEPSLDSAKKAERLQMLGQLDQRKVDTSLRVPRLPDLEAVEGTQDDVLGRLVLLGAGLVPVLEGLVTVFRKALRLCRTLHLDEAHARPEHVDVPTGRDGHLEPNADGVLVDAVAAKELDQEGDRLGLLGPLPCIPFRGELGEAPPDLSVRKRHGAQLRASVARRERRRMCPAGGRAPPRRAGARFARGRRRDVPRPLHRAAMRRPARFCGELAR